MSSMLSSLVFVGANLFSAMVVKGVDEISTVVLVGLGSVVCSVTSGHLKPE